LLAPGAAGAELTGRAGGFGSAAGGAYEGNYQAGVVV